MTDMINSPNSRRTFLHSSANIGLLSAAVALLSRSAPLNASELAPAPDTGSSTPSGYHETEHIRKYYAKARQF